MALTLLQAGVLDGPQARNALQGLLGVAALRGGGLLLDDVIDQPSAGRFEHAVPVGTSVPRHMTRENLPLHHFFDLSVPIRRTSVPVVVGWWGGR